MRTAFLALALSVCPVHADDPGAPQVFADMGLTIQAPVLEGLVFELGDESGQVRGTWTGKIGSVQVEAVLLFLPNTEFGFGEATDVVSLVLDNLRDPESSGDPAFQWETKKLLPGAFGFAPYAQLASGPIRKDTKIIGTRYVLGGLLKDSGYAIEAAALPVPGPTQAKVIQDWLEKGVTYAGPLRNAKWEDA